MKLTFETQILYVSEIIMLPGRLWNIIIIDDIITDSNDYYYDIQLPINHVISKTVLHLVAVCITSQKHSKHMLKVCRKFSKKI